MVPSDAYQLSRKLLFLRPVRFLRSLGILNPLSALCLCLGAGMLENTLSVLCTPPFNLLGAQTPTAEQLDDALDCQEHGSPHSSCAAKQLEAAQQLPGICHEGSPPSSSDSVQQPLLPHSAPDVTSSTCTTCSQGTPATGSDGGGDSGGGATAGASSAPDAAPGAPSTSGSSASFPPPSEPSSHPSGHASPTAATVSAGKQALKSVVARFSPMTAPAEEEEYQAWKHAQISSLSSCWCMIQVLCWVVMVIRSLRKGEQGSRVSVSAELGILVPAVPTFTIAAFLMSKAGSHKELVHVATLIIRAGICLVLGLGVVPVPSMWLPLLSSRAEIPAEIFMNAVAEQPRVGWMLPLRLVHTIGYGLWYAKDGVAAPWFQACALNACALAVSLVMDARYRRSYAQWARSNAKRSGKPDGSHHLLCNGVSGCRQSEGEQPPKASSSTAPKCKQV